jgi:hypothetical protein
MAMIAVLLATPISMFSMAAGGFVEAAIPRSLQPEWLANFRPEVTRLTNIVFETAMPWFFSYMVFWAVVIAFAVAVVGLMAVARFVLFYLLGVADLARSKEELLALVVGSLSVSMVPEGGAESYQILGSARFNHTAIYNDERTITKILQHLKQIVGDDCDEVEAISTRPGED